MSGNPSDQNLLQIVSVAAPNDIDDVIAILQAIDRVLPSADGLKWFNMLYLMVTEGVRNSPPPGGFQHPQWITRLDVVFAQLYFDAISNFIRQSAPTPSSWQALFEARHNAGVERIQFALAGINAHINHDLSLALLQTNSEFNLIPTLNSPEHQDFEHVNNILEAVLPEALHVLADGGIIGEIAQDTGLVGRMLAIWNVRQARDLAWDFADHLRELTGLRRRVALLARDKLTGALGRSLLLPLH
jgi:hypothetical protein